MNAQINGSTRHRQEPAAPLAARNLSAGYTAPIVQGVEIDLTAGTLTALIGPNGSGKSTILKSLCGRLRPLAGTVIVEGAKLASLRERDLARTLAVHDTSRPSPELLTCRDVVEAGRFPTPGDLAPSRTPTAMRSKRRLRSAILKISPNGISQPLATGSGSAR